jgi:uncharacterized protein
VHPASVPDRSTMRSRKTSTRSKSTTWLFSLLILIASALCQAPLSNTHADFSRRLVAAAIDRTHHAVRYDPAYVRIPYPGGDVPADTGVCTDEIIRSYRAVGVDLQKEVLRTWQRISPTSPEARVGSPGSWTQISITVECRTLWFFSAKGRAIACHKPGEDYTPGDLVTWDIGGGVPHIGMVVDRKAGSGNYMIVHNIGQGPRMEDVLLNWKITGHYRYLGPKG